MLWRKSLLVSLAILLAGAVAIHAAQPKEYPAKPIEIMVQNTPGSSFDILARIIASLAPKYLGQPMVVVNKVGAAGSIVAADVISSGPDGYKIALLTTAFFSTITKTQKVPFSPADLTPVANFTEQKQALIVKGDSPYKTLDDLLSYGKKNPGQLKWSHVGKGAISHIDGLLLFRKAGIETTDIPYKGGPEMLAAILGGHIDASIITLGMLKDQVKAGKIKPLVFLSEERYSDYPDVPCVSEAGFGEAAKVKVLVGFYVHRKTPEHVKKTLVEACKKIYDDPEFKKKVEELGDEPRYGTADFIKASIKKEEEINIPILKEFGLYTGK